MPCLMRSPVQLASVREPGLPGRAWADLSRDQNLSVGAPSANRKGAWHTPHVVRFFKVSVASVQRRYL
jgi:hypothetical protein